MSLAALILSICAIIIGRLPFVSFIAIILAILALIFGIVSIFSKNPNYKKSESITAIVFSSITLLFVIFKIIMFIFFGDIDIHFDSDNNHKHYNSNYDYEDEPIFDDEFLRDFKMKRI